MVELTGAIHAIAEVCSTEAESRQAGVAISASTEPCAIYTVHPLPDPNRRRPVVRASERSRTKGVRGRLSETCETWHDSALHVHLRCGKRR